MPKGSNVMDGEMHLSLATLVVTFFSMFSILSQGKMIIDGKCN